MKNPSKSSLSWAQFTPLIIIFTLIIVCTIIRQIINGFNFSTALSDFMGIFFIIFGTFKLINLVPFVTAYRQYDLITQHFTFYGYLYPFIELALGILFLTRSHLVIANWVTLLLMIIGSSGVLIQLRKGNSLTCACLGAVFKLPMTYVTLAEDILMGLMALIMIIYH